jgi:hypothetical protein
MKRKRLFGIGRLELLVKVWDAPYVKTYEWQTFLAIILFGAVIFRWRLPAKRTMRVLRTETTDPDDGQVTKVIRKFVVLSILLLMVGCSTPAVPKAAAPERHLSAQEAVEMKYKDHTYYIWFNRAEVELMADPEYGAVFPIVVPPGTRLVQIGVDEGGK